MACYIPFIPRTYGPCRADDSSLDEVEGELVVVVQPLAGPSASDIDFYERAWIDEMQAEPEVEEEFEEVWDYDDDWLPEEWPSEEPDGDLEDCSASWTTGGGLEEDEEEDEEE